MWAKRYRDTEGPQGIARGSGHLRVPQRTQLGGKIMKQLFNDLRFCPFKNNIKHNRCYCVYLFILKSQISSEEIAHLYSKHQHRKESVSRGITIVSHAYKSNQI